MEIRGYAAVVAAVIACGAAGMAGAQVVSKCPDGKGGFVYQDTPCVNGQAAREWDGAAHRLSPERQRQIDADRRHRELLAASRSPSNINNVVFNGPSASQQQNARCDAAKAHRKQELDRLGLRRTYDILRNLNDYVNRECARR